MHRRQLVQGRARARQVDGALQQRGRRHQLDQRPLEVAHAAAHRVDEQVEAVLGQAHAASRGLAAQDAAAHLGVGRFRGVVDELEVLIVRVRAEAANGREAQVAVLGVAPQEREDKGVVAHGELGDRRRAPLRDA